MTEDTTPADRCACGHNKDDHTNIGCMAGWNRPRIGARCECKVQWSAVAVTAVEDATAQLRMTPDDLVAHIRTPDRWTCKVCGHEDWATELYAAAGPAGAFAYCRNHNSCRDRERANRTKPKEPTMEFGEYTAPVATEGDTYRARDHYGNSAIIKVLEHKGEIVTPNSPNGAPGVICDVYDLNLKVAFRDVLMMTGAIVDGLKPHVGKNPVVIKWGKAVAKNGRDYPTAEPASEGAITAAKAVYAAGDPFAPAVGTIESEAPF